LAALWGDVPTQRCTVHKHRNLLAHAPQRLHDEVSADYNDMIYATSPAEIEQRRQAFLCKWRLRCKAVAGSLEEAGDRLFTFTWLPRSQWKSARTTDEIDKPFSGWLASARGNRSCSREGSAALLSVEGTVARGPLGCGFVNADSRRRRWPQASVYKAASQQRQSAVELGGLPCSKATAAGPCTDRFETHLGCAVVS
jgi:Transposase, Mutator family